MSKLKDRFGHAIEVGSVVTWPTRQGSNLNIIDGVVTEVAGQTVTVKTFIQQFRDSEIRWTEALDRITVVRP